MSVDYAKMRIITSILLTWFSSRFYDVNSEGPLDGGFHNLSHIFHHLRIISLRHDIQMMCDNIDPIFGGDLIFVGGALTACAYFYRDANGHKCVEFGWRNYCLC